MPQVTGWVQRRRGPTMKIDLAVAQLLCSRLCHDLVGPAGAINVGVELLEETAGAGADAETVGLLGRVARQVKTTLAFYRVAFGFGGMVEDDDVDGQVREVAEAFVGEGPVELDWPLPGPETPALDITTGKLLLNMMLLGHGALIRGGTLAVRVIDLGEEGRGIAVVATGDRARLRDELRAAATAPVAAAATVASTAEGGIGEALTAYTVQAALTRLLADAIGAELEVTDTGEGEVRIAALVGRTA